MERRFVFNDIAELYDEVRPGYPAQLVDDVVAAASLHAADRILEVGCGTGLATRSFAERGYRILGLDPGARMIEVARKSLASLANVAFSETTFEAWEAERDAFQLVISAQAWHWVPPDVSFAKAAAALKPLGLLAVFGHTPTPLAAPLQIQFDELYHRLAPGMLDEQAKHWYRQTGPLPAMFRESGLFEPSVHKAYASSSRLSSLSYARLQSSTSAIRMLPPDIRDELLNGIAAIIDAQGGHIDVPNETHLHMAKRKG
jgi:SAM-dependent methyltransferase